MVLKLPDLVTHLFFQFQLKECEKFLANPEIGEVFLHSIGNSMSRGINLALKLEKNSGGLYQTEVNTSTIELVGKRAEFLSLAKSPELLPPLPDDLHPLNDEDDFMINKRQNSALHIRVFCTVPKEEKAKASTNP